MPTFLTSGSAQEFAPRNKLRISLQLQNNDASIICYVKKQRTATDVSSTDYDFEIGPKGSISINSLTDGKAAIQERYTIIPASGTPRVSFFETEELDR